MSVGLVGPGPDQSSGIRVAAASGGLPAAMRWQGSRSHGALNFHVDDARATAASLNEMGVSWLQELEERPSGLFGTLIDPDGNYLQIIEFTEPYN
jgi:predicted enzyme related to lactoylglutathione lyase